MIEFMSRHSQVTKAELPIWLPLSRIAASQKIILLSVLLTVAFGSGCCKTRQSAPTEPSYQGRSLSSWLTDFDHPVSEATQAIAAEAVRHIGSPAVPFLINRLSEDHHAAFLRALKEWQYNSQAGPRPQNPRNEAYSGLDALGDLSAPALPALEKLLAEVPADPTALYIIARAGPAGMAIPAKYLASNNKQLRLEARVVCDLISTRSEILYPRIPAGPDAPSLQRRICEFNLQVMHAAFLEYSQTHPQAGFPAQPVPSGPASRHASEP